MSIPRAQGAQGASGSVYEGYASSPSPPPEGEGCLVRRRKVDGIVASVLQEEAVGAPPSLAERVAVSGPDYPGECGEFTIGRYAWQHWDAPPGYREGRSVIFLNTHTQGIGAHTQGIRSFELMSDVKGTLSMSVTFDGMMLRPAFCDYFARCGIEYVVCSDFLSCTVGELSSLSRLFAIITHHNQVPAEDATRISGLLERGCSDPLVGHTYCGRRADPNFGDLTVT